MKKISSIIFILAIICANSVLFRGHRFPFFRRPHFGPRISNVKININGKLIENAYLFKPVKSEKAKNNPEVTDQDIKQMEESITPQQKKNIQNSIQQYIKEIVQAPEQKKRTNDSTTK